MSDSAPFAKIVLADRTITITVICLALLLALQLLLKAWWQDERPPSQKPSVASLVTPAGLPSSLGPPFKGPDSRQSAIKASSGVSQAAPRLPRNRSELIHHSKGLGIDGEGLALTRALCETLNITAEEAALVNTSVRQLFQEQCEMEQKLAELVDGDEGPGIRIPAVGSREALLATLTADISLVLGTERGEQTASLIGNELFFGTSDCDLLLYFAPEKDGTMMRTVEIKGPATNSRLGANDALYSLLSHRFPYWEALAKRLLPQP